MNATGHNDEGASGEVDELLPSSKLAHCLDDVIKVRGRVLFFSHAVRKKCNDDVLQYNQDMVSSAIRPFLLEIGQFPRHLEMVVN